MRVKTLKNAKDEKMQKKQKIAIAKQTMKNA